MKADLNGLLFVLW